MTLKNKDFQRLVKNIKGFIEKLNSDEATGVVRDSLNYTLLHLHKYFKSVRNQNKFSGINLENSLSLSASFGSLSPASPFIQQANEKFDWRWINLDSPKLSSSFGYGESSNLLPEIFQVIRSGDVNGLEELIEKDCDCINEVDVLGRPPSFYCIQGKEEEHTQCLKVLLQNNIDVAQESNDGLTCFHLAALTDNYNALELLLNTKELTNIEDNLGRYPIHYAAGHASKELCQLLLDTGGDKACRDNDKMTPAMWACLFDRVDNAELLFGVSTAQDDETRFQALAKEMKEKCSKGKTILHYAVSKLNNKHCFKLIFNDESMKVKDNGGKNVLHAMAINGAYSAMEEYFACEGDLQLMESADLEGRTPLHLACSHGHGQVVDLLLNKGATIDVKDSKGMTPVNYVESKNLHYCGLVIQYHRKYRFKSSFSKSSHNNFKRSQGKENKPPLEQKVASQSKQAVKQQQTVKVSIRPPSADSIEGSCSFDVPQDADSPRVPQDTSSPRTDVVVEDDDEKPHHEAPSKQIGEAVGEDRTTNIESEKPKSGINKDQVLKDERPSKDKVEHTREKSGGDNTQTPTNDDDKSANVQNYEKDNKENMSPRIDGSKINQEVSSTEDSTTSGDDSEQSAGMDDKKQTRRKESSESEVFDSENSQHTEKHESEDESDHLSLGENMIVLVNNPESDEELVIDIDGGKHDVSSEQTPFARTESLTTVNEILHSEARQSNGDESYVEEELSSPIKPLTIPLKRPVSHNSRPSSHNKQPSSPAEHPDLHNQRPGMFTDQPGSHNSRSGVQKLSRSGLEKRLGKQPPRTSLSRHQRRATADPPAPKSSSPDILVIGGNDDNGTERTTRGSNRLDTNLLGESWPPPRQSIGQQRNTNSRGEPKRGSRVGKLAPISLNPLKQ